MYNYHSITENIRQHLQLKQMKACVSEDFLLLETIRLNLTLVASQGTALKSSVAQ